MTLTVSVAELETALKYAQALNNKYAWERDKAREERDTAERRSEAFWKPRYEQAEARLRGLREAARTLLEAVDYDNNGRLVGMQPMGGNGGLISLDTTRAADQLRLALASLQPEHPAS